MLQTYGKCYGVKRLLMPLLFIYITESDLPEEIIWVCVGRSREVLKEGRILA